VTVVCNFLDHDVFVKGCLKLFFFFFSFSSFHFFTSQNPGCFNPLFSEKGRGLFRLYHSLPPPPLSLSLSLSLYLSRCRAWLRVVGIASPVRALVQSNFTVAVYTLGVANRIVTFSPISYENRANRSGPGEGRGGWGGQVVKKKNVFFSSLSLSLSPSLTVILYRPYMVRSSVGLWSVLQKRDPSPPHGGSDVIGC